MKKWNADLMIPTGSEYAARITGAKFENSKSSGNPMVTVKSELVSPDAVEIGGEEVNVAGVSLQPRYFSTKYINKDGSVDEVKTEEYQNKFKIFYGSLGLDTAEINWDNIDTKPLEGKIILVAVEAEKKEKRATPTADEIEQAKKKNQRPEGKVMKNPLTGKAMIQYWPRITDIFGLAPDQTMASNKPY